VVSIHDLRSHSTDGSAGTWRTRPTARRARGRRAGPQKPQRAPGTPL